VEVKFNINDYVKVKLTKAGREELKRQHEELKLTFPKLSEWQERKIDADGYSRFQMHDLMSSLGILLTPCRELPFDTEIIIEVSTPTGE
jgi:hypothetical protein